MRLKYKLIELQNRYSNWRNEWRNVWIIWAMSHIIRKDIKKGGKNGK